MRGVSAKNRLKAELVAAGRVAYMESGNWGNIPSLYLTFPKQKQVWRLSEDILDSYEDEED